MSGFEVVALLLAWPTASDQIIKAGKDQQTRVKAVRNLSTMIDCDKLAVFEYPARLKQRFNDEFETTFTNVQLFTKNTLIYVEQVEGWHVSRWFWNTKERRSNLRDSVVKLDRLTADLMATVDLSNAQDRLPAHVLLDPGSWQRFTAVQTNDVRKTVNDQVTVQLVQGILTKRTSDIEPKKGTFLCDLRYYLPQMKGFVNGDRRVLTELLASSVSTECVLKVVGDTDNAEDSSLDVHFDIPSTYTFRGSLRTVIQEEPIIALNKRVPLVVHLTAVVLRVTSLKLVHKKNNSANVVIWRMPNRIEISSDSQVLSSDC